MAVERRPDHRMLVLRIHQAIGLVLFLLLAPLAAAGALAMLRPTIDAAIHPERRPITLAPLVPPLSAYQAAADAAFGPGATVTTLYLKPGDTVVANGRLRPALDLHAPRDAGPPMSLTAWIDPGSARLLAIQKQRGPGEGAMALALQFHETLLLDGAGRRLVGLLGVVMLIQAMTGLCLWWPSVRPLWFGLRWRRTGHVLTNLHHLTGFWSAVPLMILAVTGIGLAFPDMTVQAISRVAPMQPVRPAGRTLFASRLNADQAATIALAGETGARISSVEQPTDTSPSWKFQVKGGGHAPVRLAVNDDTGAVTTLAGGRATSGNVIERAIARVHAADGEGLGWDVWRWIAIVAGLAPTGLALTGVAAFGARQLRRLRAAAHHPR